MKKAIRKVTYKMKPSVSQEESLMDLFVHHHQLYNWALRDRIETYRDSNYSLNFHEQCKINTLWRNNRKARGIFNANAQSEQVTLKRVALAFDGFLDGSKKVIRKLDSHVLNHFNALKVGATRLMVMVGSST